MHLAQPGNARPSSKRLNPRQRSLTLVPGSAKSAQRKMRRTGGEYVIPNMELAYCHCSRHGCRLVRPFVNVLKSTHGLGGVGHVYICIIMISIVGNDSYARLDSEQAVLCGACMRGLQA